VYSGVLTNVEAERKITGQSNVDYLVLGHYNVIGDSVILVVSVNDVVEKKILFTTPIIKCATSNPMKAVMDAQQFVLGFLMFSTKKDRGITRPPRYDAYKEYLKGMELWALNDTGPGNIGVRQTTDIESYYFRAIALDPDFLPPYFQLTELFSLTRRFKGLDSVLQILDPKQYLFLESDSLNFAKQRFLRNKDWDGLEKFLLTKVDKGNSNLRPYYELAVNALYRQNMPSKALNYIALSDLGQYDFDNKPADQLLYYVKVSAWDKLGLAEEIEKLLSNLTFRLKIHGVQYVHWKTIYKLHGKDAAMAEFEKHPIPTAATNLGFYAAYFRYCQIQNDTSGMHYFLNHFPQLPSGPSGAEFLKAVMLFRMGRTSEAERSLTTNLPTVERQRRIHMLGLLYAATGRTALAQKTIGDLLSNEAEFDNGITRYYVAKIEAEMGNKETSVNYLKEAIARGFEFRQDLFEFDADLKNLFGYPAFIDLVTPKE